MTANEAWLKMLRDVMADGVDSAPRGQTTKEILGYQSVVDMTRPMVTAAGRVEGHFFEFMVGEAFWILSGDNRVATIRPFSKMISRFSDDGARFRGAYGPKIQDQLSHVVQTLSNDPDSRQAVINIWRENPAASKDVPCTLSAQFFIRDRKIHCADTMRSSDAWLGWPFDIFNFSMLSALVASEINDYRWRQGQKPLVDKLGTLRLTAGSQHVYERNFEKILRILANKDGAANLLTPCPKFTLGFTHEPGEAAAALMKQLEKWRDLASILAGSNVETPERRAYIFMRSAFVEDDERVAG